MRTGSGLRGAWRLAMAAVIIAGLGAGVYAQQRQQAPGPGGWQGRGMRAGGMRAGGPMAGGPMARLGVPLGQLNLTDEQKQQVKSIVDGHRADFRGLADRARPARRALADAVASGDEAAIRQRSADVGAVQTDRLVLTAKVRNEIFQILTPAQRQKAQALRQQFEQRMERRRQAGPRKDRFPG